LATIPTCATTPVAGSACREIHFSDLRRTRRDEAIERLPTPLEGRRFTRFSLFSGGEPPYFFRLFALESVRFGARSVEAALAAAFALLAPGLRPGLPGVPFAPFALVAAGAAAAGAAAADLALPLPRAGASGVAGFGAFEAFGAFGAFGVFVAGLGRSDMGLRREDVVPARTPCALRLAEVASSRVTPPSASLWISQAT